ncbi:MAG: SMC-Scp complex subunit ScpB [Oligoflexia bacterium]|nr:SMC-Scp complex subunit ScpB [Oligoflexia bacterium]
MAKKTNNEITEILDAAETARAMEAELGEATKEGAIEALEAVTDGDTEELPVLPNELEDTQAKSVIESLLFAASNPLSVANLRGTFHGTNINSQKIRELLALLQVDYAGGDRGICLEEVAGGYQLRTKVDNAGWMRKMVKARPFKLSGPALEVLSIIAYKQPVVKSEVDQIRGVESGHLVRALMEKNIVRFVGKSELPGKPMLYGTTKDFLELFGLRNIRELPTLSEIDELIPEGIGELEDLTEKETLGDLTDKMALSIGKSYSESESELLTITTELSTISTSSEFFEQEKKREKERKENERAQDLRERQIIGETLLDSDARWLAKFDARLEAAAKAAIAAEAEVAVVVADVVVEEEDALTAFKNYAGVAAFDKPAAATTTESTASEAASIFEEYLPSEADPEKNIDN